MFSLWLCCVVLCCVMLVDVPVVFREVCEEALLDSLKVGPLFTVFLLQKPVRWLHVSSSLVFIGWSGWEPCMNLKVFGVPSIILHVFRAWYLYIYIHTHICRLHFLLLVLLPFHSFFSCLHWLVLSQVCSIQYAPFHSLFFSFLLSSIYLIGTLSISLFYMH